MQNFYKKKSKSAKNGYKKASQSSRKPKKGKSMTIEQMNRTVEQEPSSRSSGTNPTFGASGGFYQRNMHKVYRRDPSSEDERRVTFEEPETRRKTFKKKKTPKVFTDQTVVDDILGGRKRGDSKRTELLLMKSDLKDYKDDVVDYDDLNRFERFLNETKPETEEVEDDDEGYGDAQYMSEPAGPDYESRDMTRELGYMDKDERMEYLNYKKMKKLAQKEEEERRINTFKPKINKRSKKIDNRRMRGMGGDRNQMLFGLKKVLDYREQQLKEIVEAEKFMRYGKKELMNCTFKPKTNRKVNSRISRSSIQERAQQFNRRKKMREMERERERDLEEVHGCTFRPKINKRKRRGNGD